MKNFNVYKVSKAPCIKLWRLFLLPVACCLLFLVQDANAQGGNCDKISFDIVHYELCKFRLTYNNTTDCYSELFFGLDQGDFVDYSANMPAGFMAEVVGQSFLRITHVNGFLPLGNQAPLIFTLPVGLVTNAAINYTDVCGMEGCIIFPGPVLESCPDPVDASIIGVKYRECGSSPYSNQATIPGWMIQLFDNSNNLLAEEITGPDGRYAFYDLPKGNYFVREVAVSGWTPKVPATGEYLANLDASQQLVRNFGNCPGCSCDSIEMQISQEAGNLDTSTYYLTLTVLEEFCFQQINIKIDTGIIVDWAVDLPGWVIEKVGNSFLLTPPSSLNIKSCQPCHFRLAGTGNHVITTSASYNIGMGAVVCSTLNIIPNPPEMIPKSCCPAGYTQGQELVADGNFNVTPCGFGFGTDYGCTANGTGVGHFAVLNGVQTGSANGSFWSCVGKSGNPNTDYFMVVDGATAANQVVWKETVTVTAMKDYCFSVWANNIIRPIYSFSDPNIEIRIVNLGGQIQGVPSSKVLTENPDKWENITLNWTPAVGGSYTLEIRTLSLNSSGNDFALDCISFRECIPPPSCACPPNAFSNMSYKPNSGPNVPISCGQIAFWQCQFPAFNLSGNFMCQGNNCPSMPPILWTLNHPNLGQVDQGTANGPGFQVSIQNADFSLPGLYTLTLKGICGGDTCFCDIIIETPGCGNNCTADFSAQHVGCGKVNFSGFANGTPTFTYAWNFGDPNTGVNNSSSLQNPMHQFSAPGSYTVTLTITDAVGCVATYSTTIVVPSFPTAVSITGNPGLNICQGQSTTLMAAGNWANCQWSNSGSGPSISVNAPGTYCVTCTDINMCTATGCVTVTQSPAPTINISGNLMVCLGQNTILTATGGGTYVWSPGGQTTPAITVAPGATTTYTVLVTGTNGCTATQSATVTVQQLPAANAGTDKLICQWQTATLMASGGGTYQWSPNNSSANPYTTAPVQANTTYTVTVTGTNGCTATDQVNVNIKVCDCVTNTIVQNGDFSNSTPCVLVDQDIQNAAFWSSIWTGYSTGDLYDAQNCSNAAVTPLSQGPYAGIWCKPHTQRVWREGIMNTLSSPILKNSGTYMVQMKIACVYLVSGTARLAVYGVGQNATSTVTSATGTNPMTGSFQNGSVAPLLNTNLFQNPSGGQLLGTYFLDASNCSSNFVQFTFNFNSNLLPNDIDRIFITRDDGAGGTTFANIDDVCIKPVLDTAACDCGPLNFAYMYRPQDGWLNPIGASQSAITAPCPKPASSYYIFGQFQCAPDQCGNNCVDWKLDRPGSLSDLTGQNCGTAYPWFVIPINNADCSQSGNYALTVTRMCGSKPCSKVFNFKLDNCICPCDSLKRDVGYGFSMASVLLPPNQCRKRFKPLALCPNDVVQWSITEVNGPYAATGTSNGNAYFQFSTPFQNSGYYKVCMHVTRTEPGTVCKWEHCRTIYIQCGIGPLDPVTRFCEENKVKNGGFNEGSSPGLLNEWGYLSDWEKAPNPGDGRVIVEDTAAAGSLEEGYVLLIGRKDNFAGIMQEVNLQPDNYLTLYFEAHNYQGADLPAGTRIEVRLQDSPFPYPGLKKQPLKVQMMVDSSGWHQIGGVTGTMLDTSLHYLVICLQNDDTVHNSIVGIDNIELCSSTTSAAPEQGGINQKLRLRIFPNPNVGTFTVALPDLPSAGMTLRILDVAGRLLQEQEADRGSKQQTVQANDLPNGLYFLQVVSEGKILAVEKFVKQ